MPSSSPSICVIGSINTDMVVKTPELPGPGQTVLGEEFLTAGGGKGANQAVAAARLGASVIMVGNVGSDSFGEQAIANLRSEKIDCQLVQQDADQPSGVALISVDANGENQIVVAPGANNTLTTEQIDKACAHLNQQSVLLLQLEVPLTAVEYAVKAGTAAGCRVILDPAPAQKLSQSMLSDLFLITPNETEAEILTGLKIKSPFEALAAAKILLEEGVQNVVITLGSAGVLLANANQEEFISAPQVTAVDSTAAGDCFNGALATALLQGETLVDAVMFACHVAATSVTRLGAQDSLPTSAEL